MRLVQRHAQALDPVRRRSKIVFPDRRDHPVEHDAREKLGRRVAALERRVVIQVPEVHLREDGVQHFRRAADVDDDAVGVERRPAKLDVDDERGAVQALRRAEHVALEAVGNHHVIAHRNAVHRMPPMTLVSIPNAMAQRVAGVGRKLRHLGRQFLELALARNQHVELVVGEHRQRELHPPARVPSRALRRERRCRPATT